MEDKQLEDALAKSIEQSFNDSELEDIMNEIENLEKEFSEDSSCDESSDDLSLKQARDNDLQDVIDQEVANVASEMESILDGATDEFEMAAKEVEAQTVPEEGSEDSANSAENEDTNVMFSEEELASIASDTQEVEASDGPAPSSAPDPIMEEMQQSQMEMSEDFNHEDPDDNFEAAQDDQQEIMASIEDQVESAGIEAHSDEDSFEEGEHIQATQENVFKLEKPESAQTQTITSAASSSSNIDFNAHGAMDLNINFNVAGQTAQLKVENGGLTLQLNGVELTISEEVGCAVKMAGGVKFSVPLETSEKKEDVA